MRDRAFARLHILESETVGTSEYGFPRTPQATQFKPLSFPEHVFLLHTSLKP